VWGPRFKKAADHEKKSLQLGAVKKLQSPTKAFTPLARGAQPQHTSRSALTYTHASIIRDTVPPVVKHPVRCCRRPRVQKKLALHLHSPPRAESCFVFPVTAGVQVFKVPNICSCMHERRVLPFIELEVGHTPSPLSRIQRRWCPADHPHRARWSLLALAATLLYPTSHGRSSVGEVGTLLVLVPATVLLARAESNALPGPPPPPPGSNGADTALYLDGDNLAGRRV